MPKTHIFIDKRNRAVVTIPSFLRDMFEFVSGEEVDITTDGKKIIITPKAKPKKAD
jgi:antitoxin component of MazEF toxin-antitoxin module